MLDYQPLRMSVEKYHALVRAGAFDEHDVVAFNEHDAVKLLDGVVTEKMSKNPTHRLASRQLNLALSQLVTAGWHVQNQEPITLETSEPESDIAIVRGELTDCPAKKRGWQRSVSNDCLNRFRSDWGQSLYSHNSRI